jgi:hypothetical protein
MLDASIELCRTLLKHNESFYPFASVAIDGDIQCIFHEPNAYKEHQLIDKLEDEIWAHTHQVQQSLSVLVYAGLMVDDKGAKRDVVVCDVTTQEGEQQQIYYPVSFTCTRPKIGSPFTSE